MLPLQVSLSRTFSLCRLPYISIAMRSCIYREVKSFLSSSHPTLEKKKLFAHRIANSCQTWRVRRRNPTSTLLPIPRTIPHPTRQLFIGETPFSNRPFLTTAPNILKISIPITNIPQPLHKPSLPPPLPTQQCNTRNTPRYRSPKYPDGAPNTPHTHVPREHRAHYRAAGCAYARTEIAQCSRVAAFASKY